MEKLIIGILFDETISRLPVNVKNINYNFKEIKKIKKKHYEMARRDTIKFQKAFELANEAWILTQNMIKEDTLDFSNIYALQLMLEDNSWLIKYFKLNTKSMEKLFYSYDLTHHIFRTKKVNNKMKEAIKITIAHYNYRNNNGK